jgi:hypothetical protein
VTGFVLHLGQQDGLAAQRRRAREPIAFRLHADDLGVRMLGNLAHQRLAVGPGHPVLRLDLLVRVDARLKSGELFIAVARRCRVGLLVQALRVHDG